MKCDLCKRAASKGAILCEECGEMIQRLLSVQERIERNQPVETKKPIMAASAGAR